MYAQLRLDSPLVCLPGDHFIVRRVSPLDTLGGGVIVDPWAARMRRKNRVLHGEQAARLFHGEEQVWLERAGEQGLSESAWKQRTGGASNGVLIGAVRFAEPIVARLEGALVEALASYHSQYPLSLGPHRRELRRGRLGHLDDKVFDALLERLARLNMVSIEGPLICVSGHTVELTTEQKILRTTLSGSIRAAGLEGISISDLHKQFPQAEVTALMKLLEASGETLLVADVGWVAATSVETLHKTLQDWFVDNEEITPGDFKEISSLTRRRAISFLEWCDQQRWTRRRGNLRMAGDKLISS